MIVAAIVWFYLFLFSRFNRMLKNDFNHFFTTKPVGVGTWLGLSVSYFIITQIHNGELSVEFQPEMGAKFIIRLPVSM